MHTSSGFFSYLVWRILSRKKIPRGAERWWRYNFYMDNGETKQGIVDFCFPLRVTVDFRLCQQKPYKHGQSNQHLPIAHWVEHWAHKRARAEVATDFLGGIFFSISFSAHLLKCNMFYSKCTQPTSILICQYFY